MLIAGVQVPVDRWYWVDDQTWALPLEGGRVRVGITALGLKASGDVFMCRPKSVGSEVVQGRSIGVVELSKSIVSVKSPLSGEVVRVNEALDEQPELVHRSPYDAGWLAELRPTSLDAEMARFAIGEPAIRDGMQRWAWLNQLESP